MLRGFRHRCFPVAAGLSLLLCFLSVWLWKQHDARHDLLILKVAVVEAWVCTEIPWDGVAIGFWTDADPLQLGVEWNSRHEVGGPVFRSLHPRRPRGDGGSFGRWGFYSEFDWWLPAVRLIVPFWFATALAAVLPLKWLTRPRRRPQRDHAPRCRTCGYDLRASPGPGCPECGAPIPR